MIVAFVRNTKICQHTPAHMHSEIGRQWCKGAKKIFESTSYEFITPRKQLVLTVRGTAGRREKPSSPTKKEKEMLPQSSSPVQSVTSSPTSKLQNQSFQRPASGRKCQGNQDGGWKEAPGHAPRRARTEGVVKLLCFLPLPTCCAARSPR